MARRRGVGQTESRSSCRCSIGDLMRGLKSEMVSGFVHNADSIATSWYEGDEPATRLVVIANATATPQTFYSNFAEDLARRGCVVATFDYSGVAQSGGTPRRDAGMSNWADDYARVVELGRERYPGMETVLFGHSLGGALALGIAPRVRPHKVVTVGAQVAYWRDWPTHLRWRRLLEWHLVYPLIATALGHLPLRALGRGENVPQKFAYEWASLCRSPFEWQRRLPHVSELGSISCSVTAVGIEDDDIGTRQALVRLHQHVPAECLESLWIRPSDYDLSTIGHFGVFRQPCCIVWKRLQQLVFEPNQHC